MFWASEKLVRDKCLTPKEVTTDMEDWTVHPPGGITGRMSSCSSDSNCKDLQLILESNCKDQQPSVSMVKKICYPEVSKVSSAATNWGLRKENTGSNMLLKHPVSTHIDYKYGMHTSSHELLLAVSTDGLIYYVCCQGSVLEIRCPHSAVCVKSTVNQKTACLEIAIGNALKLKRQHAYFTQIQMQLSVCQHSYWDFFVWTPADSQLEWIFMVVDFSEGAVNKSRGFFKMVLLTELLFKSWMSSEKKTNVPEYSYDDRALHYCYCGGPESGDMVQCSGPDCEGIWFQFECATLKCPPKAKAWFCKGCKPWNKSICTFVVLLRCISSSVSHLCWLLPYLQTQEAISLVSKFAMHKFVTLVDTLARHFG